MRILAAVLGVIAAVLLLVAGASIKWYVWDVAIGQAGASDRSMIFWGIPILFIGIATLISGVGLIVLAVRNLRSSRLRGR